tara:strand:- start:134 stop:433 length:300 start_codon:yes stop_codon:yes gene_type:complete
LTFHIKNREKKVSIRQEQQKIRQTIHEDRILKAQENRMRALEINSLKQNAKNFKENNFTLVKNSSSQHYIKKISETQSEADFVQQMTKLMEQREAQMLF